VFVTNALRSIVVVWIAASGVRNIAPLRATAPLLLSRAANSGGTGLGSIHVNRSTIAAVAGFAAVDRAALLMRLLDGPGAQSKGE